MDVDFEVQTQEHGARRGTHSSTSTLSGKQCLKKAALAFSFVTIFASSASISSFFFVITRRALLGRHQASLRHFSPSTTALRSRLMSRSGKRSCSSSAHAFDWSTSFEIHRR